MSKVMNLQEVKDEAERRRLHVDETNRLRFEKLMDVLVEAYNETWIASVNKERPRFQDILYNTYIFKVITSISSKEDSYALCDELNRRIATNQHVASIGRTEGDRLSFEIHKMATEADHMFMALVHAYNMNFSREDPSFQFTLVNRGSKTEMETALERFQDAMTKMDHKVTYSYIDSLLCVTIRK
jgi:hypothetical protein